MLYGSLLICECFFFFYKNVFFVSSNLTLTHDSLYYDKSITEYGLCYNSFCCFCFCFVFYAFVKFKALTGTLVSVSFGLCHGHGADRLRVAFADTVSLVATH